MEESGFNAGHRNVGRTALFAIPWLLGAGACIWLTFYVGIQHERAVNRQRERAAEVVGAVPRPTGKIEVQIERRGICANVTKAEVDGSTLRLYAINDCHQNIIYMEWYFEVLSPNKTILTAGWHNGGNCPNPTQPGDSAECVFDVGTDDRAAVIRVYTGDVHF